MASIEDLKQRIDLHDLAERLGLERPGGTGNYRSPHHADKSPSLSVFEDGKKWKDWSTDEGGTCIDLVMYVRGIEDVGDAIRDLHEIYGLPDKPERVATEDKREQSRAEYIAARCTEQADRVVDYLASRGISEEVVRRAIKKGAVGFNAYVSPTKEPGTPGHGGAAAAFIVRSLNPGHIVAVDLRYLEPALNGGVKTQCQGDKEGYGWTSDIQRLLKARTVYVVESPINALSIECCELTGAAAFATRGTGNVHNIDWSFALPPNTTARRAG